MATSNNAATSDRSSSDLHLTHITSIPSPPETVKTSFKVGIKAAPPDYDEATPPPSYPASINATGDFPNAEGRAGYGPAEGKRKRWLRRHPWWCAFILLLLLTATILGAVLGSMTSCNSSGYCSMDSGSHVVDEGHEGYYTPTSTSTLVFARPTGFAEGKRERLVYTDVGRSRPFVGTEVKAVTVLDGESKWERVFYHDTHGQIYESAAKRTANEELASSARMDTPWVVYKIPDAVMPVNSSMAVIAIQHKGGYNTTALFFYTLDGNQDQVDRGTICRLLTRTPGEYERVVKTPYTMWMHDYQVHQSSLAAAQLGKGNESRVLLGVLDVGPGDRKFRFHNGMWDSKLSNPWNRYEGYALGVLEHNVNVHNGTSDDVGEIAEGSPLVLQSVVTTNGIEGVVVGYAYEKSTDDVPSYGERTLVTRWELYTKRNATEKLDMLIYNDRVEKMVINEFPSLELFPPADYLPTKHAFIAWSCSNSECERTLYQLDAYKLPITTEKEIFPGAAARYNITKVADQRENSRKILLPAAVDIPDRVVTTTDDGVIYAVGKRRNPAVEIEEEETFLVELVVDVGIVDGVDVRPREIGRVRLFE